MASIMELSDIEKRFGDRIGLRFEYLSIESGRVYMLTGPNGAGKSTLLHLMALLETPDRGEMSFGGQRISLLGQGDRQARHHVTLMHQNPYILRGTVADNVAYGLRLRGMKRDDLENRVEQALEQVHLSGFALRNACCLSGGESRRVALARALACSPQLLLLDEPLANLDRESVAILEEAIAGLPKKGTTVVMASHDRDQVERLNAATIRLEGGRLIAPLHRRPAEQSCGWNTASICPALRMNEA